MDEGGEVNLLDGGGPLGGSRGKSVGGIGAKQEQQGAQAFTATE
jgi:hypothetical protein